MFDSQGKLRCKKYVIKYFFKRIKIDGYKIIIYIVMCIDTHNMIKLFIPYQSKCIISTMNVTFLVIDRSVTNVRRLS